MHGVIFFALQKYVTVRYGDAAWNATRGAAGVHGRTYLASQAYPDAELVALVTEAAQHAQTSVPVVLEDFGAFMAPSLLHTYRAHLKPQWRTLDVLAHTEATMHKAVRGQDPSADPPYLSCERTSPTEVVITYTSQRRLCAVAKGMVRGVAEHFDERVVLAERTCMLSGASCCTLVVRMA
jgi:Haem-NO-binding